jgi:amino acid permease
VPSVAHSDGTKRRNPTGFQEGFLSYVLSAQQFNIFHLFYSFTRPGGVRATIFNLLNATAGAAVIAIPGAFRASGLGLAFLQIIMACLVNYVSSSCLLYTSFEWGCFSYSGLAMNCSSRWFTKFVDFIFFVNVYGTTLSYSVLIQGNLVSSFGFIRSKYWTNMPFILDDEDSIFWVIVFSVVAGDSRSVCCHWWSSDS